MRGSAEPVDLDVLPDPSADGRVADSPAPSASRAGRRRWPWLVAGLALVAAVVAFPVRVRLAGAQFQRLDVRWNEAAGLDNSRSALISQLRSAATPEDRDRVDSAVAALDDELAGRLQRIQRAVGSERIVDGGVRQLARTERRALATAVTSLRQHRYTRLDPAGTVHRHLDRQRERWHRGPAAGPAPRPLTAANPALDALGKWFEEPTGATLAVVSDRHLMLLDLDRSQLRPLEPEVHADFVLARQGFLVVLDGDEARTVTPGEPEGAATGATVRDLGPADGMVAAIDPGAVWLVRNHVPLPGGPGTRSVATKVDATGRQLARWEGTAVPAGDPPQFTEDMVAETTAGLLVVHTGTLISMSLEIVPVDGSPATTLTSVGFPFAASATGVAWVDNRTPDHQLHIWSAATRTDRTVPNPPGYEVAGLAEFSPDGSVLVASYQDANAGPEGARLGTVGPAAGDVRLGGALPASLNAAGFSADGRWLFLAGRGERPLSAYRLDDGAVRELRAHGFTVSQLAAMR